MGARDVRAAAEAAAEETKIDQIHRVLVEVKEFLETTATQKGQQLLGKVDLVLGNWDDDALFSSEVEFDEEEEGDGGSFFEDDDDDL